MISFKNITNNFSILYSKKRKHIRKSNLYIFSSGGLWLGEGSQPSRISDSQQSSSSSTSGGSTITDINTESQKLLMAKMTQAGSTSPVAVPSRTSLRQRNESSSSLSVGRYVTFSY